MQTMKTIYAFKVIKYIIPMTRWHLLKHKTLVCSLYMMSLNILKIHTYQTVETDPELLLIASVRQTPASAVVLFPTLSIRNSQ